VLDEGGGVVGGGVVVFVGTVVVPVRVGGSLALTTVVNIIMTNAVNRSLFLNLIPKI